MSGVKARKVLGVQKCSPGYSWFYLSVDGLPTLGVDEGKVTWEIDDAVENAVAYIQRTYEKGSRGEKYLTVKKAKIVGPERQIKNLLYSIGHGTPEYSVGPRWKEGEEGDY